MPENTARSTQDQLLKVDPSAANVSIGVSTEQLEDRIREVSKDLIISFITIFGIFAAFVTFLSIEIQIFKTIDDNFWLLIGLSTLIISIVFCLLYAVQVVAKSENELKLGHPLLILSYFFLALTAASFVLAVPANLKNTCQFDKCFQHYMLK